MPAWTFHRAAALAILATLPVAGTPVLAADVQLRQWPARQPTPALHLASLNGQAWDLAALRGKVVVVNFWAGWCGPCVDELPVLAALAQRDPVHVAVVGVNYKEGLDAITRFTAGHPLPYPVLRDRDGAAFAAWTGGVMPTTIVVDRQGRARWRTVGQIDPDDTRLAEAIAELVSQ